jgi:hypothetical protein
MEAIRFSEMLVHLLTTRRYIPEYGSSHIFNRVKDEVIALESKPICDRGKVLHDHTPLLSEENSCIGRLC